MKKTALQICSGAFLVILIEIVSAEAQTQYRAHIPFDFTIGQNSYHAGDYFIKSVNALSANNAIVISDAKGRNSHIILMAGGEDYAKAKIGTLVFNRYETQYSLSEINTPSFIAKLAKSKAEETVARNRNVQRNTVALTMKN